MNVNGIGKQSYYKDASGYHTKRKKEGGSFYESLSGNIDDKAQTPLKKGSAAVPSKIASNIGYPYPNVSAAGLHESNNVALSAVSECEVRHITYQESGFVRAFAAQGFTLMAQADVQERSVYIEQRMEDGTVKGYVIDMDKVDGNTKDPIEQTALEAWEKACAEEESEETELTVEEALLQFYEFIEDRIKNGPPKYQIGNAEFSIAEWDKLLESIDDQLDTIREEMRERIEKLKEQMLEAEQAGKQQLKEQENQDIEKQNSDEEDIEEELLSSLFQDNILR